jgi:hypothetical protein
MQFMPGTWREIGHGDPLDPLNSIDAGARYLKKLHDAYGDWDAAVAHYNGGGAQAAIVRGGGRPTIPETAAYLDRVKGYLGKTFDEHAAAAVRAEPDLVPAARVAQAAAALEGSRLTADTDLAGRDAHIRAVETAADQIGAGERVDVAAVLGERAAESEAFPPLPRLKGDDLIGKTYEQLDAMHAAAVEQNKAVELEGIRRFFGEEPAREAAGWNKRKRENWLLQNETDQASDWMQARYINDELIAEHRAAVNNFDTENAQALGRSIALAARKVDEPGFFSSPEGHTFANALRYAKERGWDLDDVMAGMRGRSAEWAGDDAPELFRRLFQQATEPRPAIAADVPRPLQLADAIDELRAARREPEPPAGPQLTTNTGDAAAAPPQPPAKAGAEAAPAQAMIDRAAAEVSMLNPDLMVLLDGMDAPVRVGDLLERVKQEAASDVADGKLVEVAAACALRH